MQRRNQKAFFTAILTILLALAPALPGYAASITFNGIPVESDVAPVIVEGRTLVPVKVINDLLGGSTQWDAATKTVTLTKEDKTIQMILGSQRVEVNGSSEQLDVPAQAVEGRTMVPLSFVAKHLGAQVAWDAATKTAMITTETSTVDTGPLTDLSQKKGDFPMITKALDDSKYSVAPTFKLKDSKGNTVSLEDYRGKFVLLNCFASWCSPCVHELPFFNETWEYFGKNQGDVIVAGMCAPGKRELDTEGMKEFIQKKDLKYTILLDETDRREAYYSYVPNSIPFTVIISPGGKIVYQKLGSVSSAKDLIQPLEKLLKGEE